MATEPAAHAPRRRGRGADPAATKADLVAAAFDTVRYDGYSGTTARSIAARAGCNQASIYYHFGGIEPLLLEALEQSSERRLALYQAELAGIDDVASLLAAVEERYAEDRESGHLTVLAELAGGITANPVLRDGIDLATRPWLDFVEERVVAATKDLPIGSLVPAADIADLIFSIILGVELRNRVDGRTDRSDRLFRIAEVLGALTGSQP